MKWQDTTIEISTIDAKLKLAIAYQLSGKPTEAIQLYLDILAQEPEHTVALHLLGVIEYQRDNMDQAVELIRKAVALDSNYTDAYYNLAIILKHQNKLEEAADIYRKVLKLNPDHEQAYNNLGTTLASQGKLKESIDTYQKLLKINPNYVNAHSNFLGFMNYDPQTTQQEIFDESRCWNDIHAVPLAVNERQHLNDRDPERRLRIGYVSPDFYNHSVSYFFDSLITEHDRQLFEVFCYAEVMKPDNITKRFHDLADGWYWTVGIKDSEVAERIREDGIDILVDLAGHTYNNRLLVFAERPAPLQVTWLGYPNTTGLSAIDYRLTDKIADPKGIDDTLHSEILVRLPNGFLCFAQLNDTPEIGEIPALLNNYITFGSFNDLVKITPEVVETWANILHKTPKSKLIIKNRSLADEKTRERYLDMFNEFNIDSNRIQLYSWVESKSGHFELYNKIDIGLDTFPFTGVTTTCESLWMGVPVIALRGDRHISRVSSSILTQVDLVDLIAESIEEYIEKAVVLANDLDQISALRGALRNQMKTSPLCDAKGFTKNVEAAYRKMWHQIT